MADIIRVFCGVVIQSPLLFSTLSLLLIFNNSRLKVKRKLRIRQLYAALQVILPAQECGALRSVSLQPFLSCVQLEIIN